MAFEGEWELWSYVDLPRFRQTNWYLRRFHRQFLNLFQCFQSIFRVHSETLNIWTHLVGFLFHLCLAFCFFSKPMLPLEAKVVFGIFFASILFYLSMSCLFHTLSCHSLEVYNLFNKLDYCGFSVLIMGSCLSWIYYAFYGKINNMAPYVLLLGLIGILVTFFQKKVFYWNWRELYSFNCRYSYSCEWNLMTIFTLALGAVVPTFHFLLTQGFKHPLYIKSFCALLLSEFLYLLGGTLNVFRLPERYSPGTFDLVFQSHQIFHILIVAASYLHYCALYNIALIA